MKRQEVLLKLQQQYQEIALQYGVSALFLFGSVDRDEARPDSDVDLLVEFTQPVGLFQFIELQQQPNRLRINPQAAHNPNPLKRVMPDFLTC